MGIFDRIKAWFRRKKVHKATTNEEVKPETPTRPPTEIEVLVQEHDHLEAERSRLKKEIELVDAQYSEGTLAAAERDRAYRTRLARAGSISIRQMEIRNQLQKMGHPISHETARTVMAY